MNLNGGRCHVMTCTDVDERQLLSMKKLLKKPTNLPWVIDDWQLVLLLFVGISTGSVHSIVIREFVDEKGVCTIGGANVIRRSEGKSSWTINKSTPPDNFISPLKSQTRLFHDDNVPILTRHLKHWLSSEMPDSNFCVIPAFTRLGYDWLLFIS